MENPVIHFRASICPLCGGSVPLQIVRLRESFDCPSCGKALKVHGIYEFVVKLTALAIGFLLARMLGFENLWVFCVGLVISPFLVTPVWRASAAVRLPVLIPATQGVTTLGLGSK